MESMFPAIRTKFAKKTHTNRGIIEKLHAARQSINGGQVTAQAVQASAASIAHIIIQSRDESFLDILRHAQRLAKKTPMAADDVYKLHELIDQRM